MASTGVRASWRQVLERAGSISRAGAAAGGFGLLHGLGFASALREAGLPALDVPLALAAFNIGIEAGQLAFIALILTFAWAVARTGVGSGSPSWLRTAGAYTIGTLAAFWCIERAAVFY